MAEPSAAPAELRALTAARGLAAWWVVLYHIRDSIGGLDGWPMAVLARGYLAVDFFFLLSGFVLWLSYAERLRGGGWPAVASFLHRRFARIWPLHAFVLTGGVMLALLLAATGRHDPVEFPFTELPWHYLLVQSWGMEGALAWNKPAWSISVESAAYLAFPLLILSIDWRRVPTPAVIAAIVALLVLLATTLAARDADTLNQTSGRLGLLRCMFEFAAGTAVCALWLRWRARPRAATIASLGVMAMLGALWAAGALPEILAVPPMFAALLLVLALSHRGGVLASAPLHWLGEVSYATYLAHYLMWKAFKLAFVAAPGAVAWPLIALYLLMVLVASGALYRWVERPAQKRINAWRFSRRRPRPSPALR
ncbi:acyltransferase family protein [Sphingomonas baiyangensis]|uniref:Acyltransferase n=1 Tax=Sphingomonas baiyangensis TaxID=2572576 RepID=A0A4U1L4A6_9SPHN|nr:acyltransferase [Sphingomonas baiyangensis]TKD51751.1 acyltransferase [Sphingomonas baiyangensis]